MRVALLVGGGVPNPSASGGTVTAWTVLTELLEQGHEVAVCALQDPELYDPTSLPAAERTERVRALGADVVPVVSESSTYFRTRPRALRDRLERSWRPLDEELYPNLVDAPAVGRAVEQLEPDVAFVYHLEMLAASGGLHGTPRLAAVGDPPHLSALYRFRDELPHPRALRRLARLQAQVRHQPRVLARLLNGCEASGAFAAHHAAWLRRRGVEGCRYLHTPVPDPVGAGWRAERDRRAPERPRILLVGHLKGIVTLEGLRSFAREILPRLERALGADGFEVRIAGGYDPPEDLLAALDRPAVRLLGHVEDAEEEFLSAHVLLTPNSIPLGVRVRIVTGFSLGTCVVSHEANARGIPELEDGANALVGRSAGELADAVLRALRDDALRRRLEAGARATYEHFFAPPVAVGEIATMLDRIVATRPVARSARP